MRVIRAGNLSLKGEEYAHKFLKNYKDFLGKFGINYSDLYPIPRKEKSQKEEFDWRIKAKSLEDSEDWGSHSVCSR